VSARRVAAWLERIWYPPPGEEAAPPPWLRLAAGAYGLAAGARAARFDRGRERPRRLPVPCVSVGNLTVGGTGKTPLVSWIVAALAGRGLRAAVVSRGYGGSASGPERVPAAGGAAAAARYGDEPAMLAARHPEVPVIVGRDRFAAGMAAVRSFGAEIVVADDAFQHRRLARDLDIAVVDAERVFGNGRLLPAGPLREPPRALARADVVVLGRIGAAADASPVRRRLAALAPRAIQVEADLEFDGLRDALSGGAAALAPGSGVFAFCGLGNPASFVRTLAAAGYRVAGQEAFGDHHRYRPAELAALARAAAACGAEAAVTSAKDAVRIAAWPGGVPLYRAEVKLAIIRCRERLWDVLNILAASGRA
jgi:tetraacyldisaccharide 4'-kinase